MFAEFPRQCRGLISKGQNATSSSGLQMSKTIVRPQKSTLMSCLDPWKTSYPVSRCHILEQRTLQLHCWENLNPRRLWFFCSRLHGVISPKIVKAEMERDGTRAETRFGFPAKRTSPFISAGVSVQSAAGSRRVRISGSNAG